MQELMVKDIMVPLSAYAMVDSEATLFEAILALDRAQAAFDQSRYPHRAVLVLDQNQTVVGKISQFDILRALEPRYAEIGSPDTVSGAVFSPKFMQSMLAKYDLWQEPLEDICRRAGQLKASNFMTSFSQGEYIEERLLLREAIHQVVMGRYHSLLVVGKNGKISGLLRLTDLFQEISQAVKACRR